MKGTREVQKLGILELETDAEFLFCDPITGNQFDDGHVAVQLPAGRYEVIAGQYRANSALYDLMVIKEGWLARVVLDDIKTVTEPTGKIGSISVDIASIIFTPIDFFENGSGIIFQVFTGADGRYRIVEIKDDEGHWCGYGAW